jgi:alpha-tubulin suppressor-like RCC1 family protein
MADGSTAVLQVAAGATFMASAEPSWPGGLRSNAWCTNGTQLYVALINAVDGSALSGVTSVYSPPVGNACGVNEVVWTNGGTSAVGVSLLQQCLSPRCEGAVAFANSPQLLVNALVPPPPTPLTNGSTSVSTSSSGGASSAYSVGMLTLSPGAGSMSLVSDNTSVSLLGVASNSWFGAMDRQFVLPAPAVVLGGAFFVQLVNATSATSPASLLSAPVYSAGATLTSLGVVPPLGNTLPITSTSLVGLLPTEATTFNVSTLVANSGELGSASSVTAALSASCSAAVGAGASAIDRDVGVLYVACGAPPNQTIAAVLVATGALVWSVLAPNLAITALDVIAGAGGTRVSFLALNTDSMSVVGGVATPAGTALTWNASSGASWVAAGVYADGVSSTPHAWASGAARTNDAVMSDAGQQVLSAATSTVITGLVNVPPPVTSCADQVDGTVVLLTTTSDSASSTYSASCLGGLALLGKLDGRSAAWKYDSVLWSTNATLNAHSFGVDYTEAKLDAFNKLPINMLRLGMAAANGTVAWLDAPFNATYLSLSAMLALAAAGSGMPTQLPLSAWTTGLVGDGASLETSCVAQGIAVSGTAALLPRVRIGVMATSASVCAVGDPSDYTTSESSASTWPTPTTSALVAQWSMIGFGMRGSINRTTVGNVDAAAGVFEPRFGYILGGVLSPPSPSAPPPSPTAPLATRISSHLGYHTCALLSSGGVQCWGWNNYFGVIGDGTTVTDRLTPTAVSGLSSGVAAIDAGADRTCALLSAGSVQCWGNNYQGRIGDGTTTNRLTPTDVSGLSSGVAAIAAGGDHTCVLLSGGRGVQCWGGTNLQGQMGDGTTTNRLTPTAVSGLWFGVLAIAAGGSKTCALLSSGGVQCWGSNDSGQIGDGTTTNRLTPTDVSGLSSGSLAITAGGSHACALLSTGDVQCWGRNMYGQIGDGTTMNRLTPTAVSGLSSGVAAITAGAEHTCALLSTGGVQCWGMNDNCQIGDGTTMNRLTPTDVSGLSSGVAAITAGAEHTCALLLTGGVQCWGMNEHGSIGDGTTTRRCTPTVVSPWAV